MFPKFPLDEPLLLPLTAHLPDDLLAANNAAHQCANDAYLLRLVFSDDGIFRIAEEAEQIAAFLLTGENARLIKALEPVLNQLAATGQGNPQFGDIAAPTWHEIAFKWRANLIFRIRVIAERVRNDKVCAEAQAAKRRPPDGYFMCPIGAKDIINAFEALKEAFGELDYPSLTRLTAAIQWEARAAAAARLRANAQTQHVQPVEATEPQPMKQPSNEAFTVYRYWFATGKTQTSLAQDSELMKQLGRTVSQGTISRWLGDVKKWLEARNVLPNPPEFLNSKPTAMDPKRIDVGANREHRPKHQRKRRTSDSDE